MTEALLLRLQAESAMWRERGDAHLCALLVALRCTRAAQRDQRGAGRRAPVGALFHGAGWTARVVEVESVRQFPTAGMRTNTAAAFEKARQENSRLARHQDPAGA